MKREIQVAFSRRAQPVWFRLIKWTALVWATKRYRHTQAFRVWMVRLFGAALGLHCFYRMKTKGWTKAWGGWNDPSFVKGESVL